MLLVCSSNVPAIVFLAETTMNTFHVLNAGFPNYPNGIAVDPVSGSLAHLSWNGKDRVLRTTRVDMLTDALHARSRLALQKTHAITHMMLSLAAARVKIATGIPLQETVYMTKKLQAQRFKDSGYNEDNILAYPYVLQYADVAQIPLAAAADEILLKARLDDDVLSKTEMIRLAYFDRVRRATTPEDIPNILKEFDRESYMNAQF
jgi:hypothetical protein